MASRLPIALCVALTVVGVAASVTVAARVVAPLRVTAARTPPVAVNRIQTVGVYPHVAGVRYDLRATNASLDAILRADQRRFAKTARREQRGLPTRDRGLYRTAIDGRYLSASSVVVSALLPVTGEVFPGQPGGDGWLGMTVRVSSGKAVRLSAIFAEPSRGLNALAAAWRAQIRATDAAPCLRLYARIYSATVPNYRAFALTRHGIAVGTPEAGACNRLVATVPYAEIVQYFNPLGRTLVAGVRAPR
jgi:hypothetical protein